MKTDKERGGALSPPSSFCERKWTAEMKNENSPRDQGRLIENVRTAVRIFRESPSLSDDQLIANLVDDGLDCILAARLVAFVPMAYFHVMLEKSEVSFPDYFEQELPDGGLERRPMISEPLWEVSLAFARADAKSGITADEYFAVAGRSAEADAANHALNAGNKLENGKFGPCRMPWQGVTRS